MTSKSKILALTIAGAAGLAIAAAIFVPKKQPYGYIAPPALNFQNFVRGDGVAYTPWFDFSTNKGDILALPVGTQGHVEVIAPIWRASVQLDAQDWNSGRQIATTNGAGLGIPFEWGSLTAAQKASLGSPPTLHYLRGNRASEGVTYRARASVLGDIIHSNPVYIGKPTAGYTFDNYLAYASANISRPGRVAVGANDGMLHVLDASTGNEVFAYVPSTLIAKLADLTSLSYTHDYFVDGPLTAGDARYDGAWHTVLVGGLGAGGKGYFALDLTNPAAASDAAAAGKILWEFHAGSAGAVNLGYGYSRPSIVRLNDGNWAAAVGNGYLSATGKASLLLLNIKTGAVISEIVVTDAAGNGLSSPALIDTNGDFKVDSAYAGDLNGNVWEFDLSGASAATWQVANAGKPLFQTPISGTVRQPITTALEVGRHPQSGYMVYVATGRLLGTSDAADLSQQAVYGLWDNNWPSAELPIDANTLVSQLLYEVTHAGTGYLTRTASTNPVNWSVRRGWKMPLEPSVGTSLDKGERVIQDIQLRSGRIHVMSVNPTLITGENWYLQLDALTGGAPSRTIVDINRDFTLDVLDNVDGDGDGTVADTARDRVIGEYQNFGLASRPVIGVIGATSDAALINHLASINPAVVVDPTDTGLYGGHFDLDTAHLIYPFNGGSTDGHVHEWDDKWDRTTIDYFSLPDGKGSPLYEINANAVEGVPPATPFILTVANTAMSPGAVLEINGASINVKDYHALVKRFLTGTMLPGETFPRYKLAMPSAAEQAAGMQRLTSFKISFDVFALLSGDLIPTKTGCVRGNKPGTLGEYRNGALLVQALDASNISGGYVLDPVQKKYVAGSNSVHATLGYATAGLEWESTIFWHWDGPCYGEATYAAEYEACIVKGTTSCWKGDVADPVKEEEKKKKADKKKKKKDEEPPPPAGQPAPPDIDHTVTNTTIAGDRSTGRLFWRELVPQ